VDREEAQEDSVAAVVVAAVRVDRVVDLARGPGIAGSNSKAEMGAGHKNARPFSCFKKRQFIFSSRLSLSV
jgi:hypothetical protein